MIYEFSFSNFRSYRNEVTIDFTSKPITEFESTIIPAEPKISLLPVCAIYGPNGGGKSGVLMAIRELRNFLVEPMIQMVFMRSKSEKLASATISELQESIITESKEDFFYKWDNDGQNKPTQFSILFKSNHRKYRYELSIFKGTIQEENLYLEDLNTGEIEAVFERDEEGVYMCDKIVGIDIEQMNEGLPLITYISMFKNIDVIDDAMRFFMNIQSLNFDVPRQDRRILVNALERDKERILNVVMSMGIAISDIRIEYDNAGNVVEIYTKHQTDGNITKELKFSEESSGTRKIFSVLPILLNGIDNGRFFIVDELDAKLHPALLRRIIELFTNPETNAKGAQMLFTSHDLTTMSNEVFRRDEIWFSAINGYHESVLYSLVDFKKENGQKTRKDENYNKQYLEGRYGADPYMKRLKNWEVCE